MRIIIRFPVEKLSHYRGARESALRLCETKLRLHNLEAYSLLRRNLPSAVLECLFEGPGEILHERPNEVPKVVDL